MLFAISIHKYLPDKCRMFMECSHTGVLSGDIERLKASLKHAQDEEQRMLADRYLFQHNDMRSIPALTGTSGA